MSAPLLWIVFPAVAAFGLALARRWPRLVNLSGFLFVGLLTLLAWRLPIGKPIILGPWPTLPRLELAPTLQVLGRSFTLNDSSRPALTLIYLGLFFWFGGVFTGRTGRNFVPIGVLVTALLTAALVVQPFLYSALFIELAALLCIPLFTTPGKAPGSGVLHFLIFQTLGMLLILLCGWMLTGVLSNPNDPEFALRVLVIAGLGFAFLSAVFPFNTWLPMLGQEANPYAAAFAFFAIPSSVSLLALSLLNQYPWLGEQPGLWQALRITGALMAVAGGVWAPFQRHMGRMLGYAVVLEIGLAMLALSLGAPEYASNPEQYPGIFFALLLPRLLALALWSQSLALLHRATGSLDFKTLRGAAWRYPVTSTSLIVAQCALAGVPLLAGFPVRLALWTALAQQNLAIALLSLAGCFGLLVGALSVLAVLIEDPGDPRESTQETTPQVLFLSLGWLLIILVGVVPQWFIPTMVSTIRGLTGSGP